MTTHESVLTESVVNLDSLLDEINEKEKVQFKVKKNSVTKATPIKAELKRKLK